MNATYTVARVLPSGLAVTVHTTDRLTAARRTCDRLNAARPTDEYRYQVQTAAKQR